MSAKQRRFQRLKRDILARRSERIGRITVGEDSLLPLGIRPGDMLHTALDYRVQTGDFAACIFPTPDGSMEMCARFVTFYRKTVHLRVLPTDKPHVIRGGIFFFGRIVGVERSGRLRPILQLIRSRG